MADETWVTKALREIEEMTPITGFNLVEVDTWRPPGDEALTLIGHFDSEVEAEAERAVLEAQGRKAYVYGPRHSQK